MIPVPILRWVLVGVAFALSGYFLVANVYPILASVSPRYQTQFFRYRPVYSLFQAEAKPTRLIIILIGVLHAGLALTFKVLFFSYYVVKSKEPDPLST